MIPRSLILGAISIPIIITVLWYTHTPTPPCKANTISVVCTTSIIADTVRAIGGEHVTVTCLMGPGIDPHVYRAREQDVHRLASADIIFYHGLHLEGKMAHLLSTMHHYATTVAVADAVPKELLIIPPDSGNQYDPHIWFDASLWVYGAESIGATLAAHDPDHAVKYAQRTENYVQKLHELHHSIQESMGHIAPHKRIIVTAHDAFAYFGKAYGCTVVGLQGMSTESEAGIADIAHLTDYIIAHTIPIVFSESALSPKALQALCNACAARGWKVKLGPTLYTDALGNSNSPASTYLDMMRYTCDVFVSALDT